MIDIEVIEADMFVAARKWFKGPKVNLDHLMHAGRMTEVIDGQSPESERSGSDVWDQLAQGEKSAGKTSS